MDRFDRMAFVSGGSLWKGGKDVRRGGSWCGRVVMVSSTYVGDAVVEHVLSHAMDTRRMASLGNVVGGESMEGLSSAHVVVGSAVDGEEMVCFMPEKPKKGRKILVPLSFSVRKPKGVSKSDATTLSLLALNVLGALENVGIYGETDVRGKNVRYER